MHEAGVPADVLRLLPGDGAVGGALTAKMAHHCPPDSSVRLSRTHVGTNRK